MMTIGKNRRAFHSLGAALWSSACFERNGDESGVNTPLKGATFWLDNWLSKVMIGLLLSSRGESLICVALGLGLFRALEL